MTKNTDMLMAILVQIEENNKKKEEQLKRELEEARKQKKLTRVTVHVWGEERHRDLVRAVKNYNRTFGTTLNMPDVLTVAIEYFIENWHTMNPKSELKVVDKNGEVFPPKNNEPFND